MIQLLCVVLQLSNDDPPTSSQTKKDSVVRILSYFCCIFAFVLLHHCFDLYLSF